jgi:DNA-binding CsgD family transcriptional regulator
MARSWAHARARDRIVTLASATGAGAAGKADRELRREVLDVLQDVTPFSWYAWLLTDPVTEVGVAPLAEVPDISALPALIKAKYATAVNRWTALRRRASPTGLLRAATGGDLARSRVWREVMSRHGVCDVASVAFADQHGCWGFLDLWREGSLGAFRASDAEFLASVTPSLTGALRDCQAMTFSAPAAAHPRDTGPVVLTLDEDLCIHGRTAASQAWLDVLLPPGPGAQAVPAGVYNVAAQLLAAEEGIDDHPAYARTHLADGLWLTLRAARLAPGSGTPGGTPGGAAIAVTIEEASATDRLDLFARASCLTSRERELLSLLATGSDTRTLARQMALSEHTIQDHLKSIFAKTGTRDRVTILARALGTTPQSSRGRR